MIRDFYDTISTSLVIPAQAGIHHSGKTHLYLLDPRLRGDDRVIRGMARLVKSMKKQKPHWTVYMLRCADGSLYTGITVDLDQRITKHNNGTGAKYTRGRGPVKLVWCKRMKTGTAARKLEAVMKKKTKLEKESMLISSE